VKKLLPETLHIAIAVATMRNGGAERAMLNLANCFANKNHRVDLILISKEGEYLNQVSEKVNVIDLKMKRSFNSFLKMKNYFSEHKPDVVIAAQSRVQVMVLVARALSGIRVPVILSEQCSVSINLFAQRSWKFFFLQQISKQILPKADFVAAVSQGAANDFKKYFKIAGEKVGVIYNSIDIAEINKRKNMEVAHPFFSDRDCPVILSAGRLAESKDFPTLLKAFQIVRKKRKVRLIILGDGIEKKNLEQLINELLVEEDVSLPGYCDNPFSYMSRSALFVLPSKSEGLPMVLLEAMACGCPVVSTDCPSGPREILADGKFGKLVPMGDTAALANAIEQTLDAPLNKEIILSRAQDFSVEKSAEIFLALFGKIISSKKLRDG
jgi:glycosyltransferase involved in cell wall biosynthesis